MRTRQLAIALLSATLIACGSDPDPAHFSIDRSSIAPAPELPPCRDRNPLNNAYFGDLHVHTGISSDAFMFGVRVRPDGAYRYAFGETVHLPPYRGEGATDGRPVQIDRPAPCGRGGAG